MSNCIYDKTDKGREEIATRKYQVPPKLRTLLVVIDGRHTLDSLLKNFAVLGLSKENVDTLAQQGFIALAGGGEEPGEPEAEPLPRSPASARARQLARSAARQERRAEPEVPAVQASAEAPAAAPAPAAKRNFFDYFNLASDAVNFSES